MVSRIARTMRAFGMALGTFQARLLLSLFYLTILVPFALVAKIQQRRRPGWSQRRQDSVQLDRSRLQF